jgi:hypothetical protein
MGTAKISEIVAAARGLGWALEVHHIAGVDRYRVVGRDEYGVEAVVEVTGRELDQHEATAYVLGKLHDQLTEPAAAEAAKNVIVTSRASIGPQEIEHRFGFHKATIEGENATLPIHRDVRLLFRKFAEELDELLISGRAKSLAFTHLEDASMWSHKAIAETAPVVSE